MSTTTTNFGLIKPELTDAADITATNQNWDTLDRVIKENKDEAKNYTDEKFGNIPAPDVSGQINAHNTSGEAHSDIRTAVNEAKQSASKALTDAKSYTDTKIAAIPTPDVSVQISAHDSSTSAHSDIRTAVNGKAPTAHAVNANTYGVGNANVFGHVKISDKTDSTSGASAGIAASPAAVKAAYDLANTAKTTATNAQTTANNKAPMYTYGTEDLTAGSSALATGQLHFVYE